MAPPDRLQALDRMRRGWRKSVERRGSTRKRSTRSGSVRWAKGKGTHRDGETPGLPIALRFPRGPSTPPYLPRLAVGLYGSMPAGNSLKPTRPPRGSALARYSSWPSGRLISGPWAANPYKELTNP